MKSFNIDYDVLKLTYLRFQRKQGIANSVHEDKATSCITILSGIVIDSKNQSSMRIKDCETISPLETHAGSLPNSEHTWTATSLMLKKTISTTINLLFLFQEQILATSLLSRMNLGHGGIEIY